MRFLSMVKHSENYRGGPPPDALMRAMDVLVQEGLKSGELVDTAGLHPLKNCISVHSAGGKVSVIDGPYAEAKEVVGGYAILEVPSREAAIESARKFMQLHATHWPEFEGTCEVRQIYGPNDMPW